MVKFQIFVALLSASMHHNHFKLVMVLWLGVLHVAYWIHVRQYLLPVLLPSGNIELSKKIHLVRLVEFLMHIIQTDNYGIYLTPVPAPRLSNVSTSLVWPPVAARCNAVLDCSSPSLIAFFSSRTISFTTLKKKNKKKIVCRSLEDLAFVSHDITTPLYWHLTLSQTKNIGAFQTERVCRRQFQIW